MADISSIKTPDNAVYDLKAKKIFYAECATARNIVNKVVDCDGFVLEKGAVIAVRFTDAGTTNATSGNITLNINGTGAKNIVPKAHNNVINYNWSSSLWNNQTWLFVYNGTYFIMLNQDYNTAYTPMSLGFGYGTCTTAEATAAKVAALASYNLVKNGIVSVKFTYAVPANATLNINNRGAKNIFYRGAKITAGIIAAGDIATFVYDGAQYQLIAVDSRNALTVGGHTVLSNVPANAKFTDTVQDLSGYAKKTDIPTSLPANGGNADTVDGQHASAFLGGGFVYKSYLTGGYGSDMDNYVTDYHGFVYNCTNTPTVNEYGFLDVFNFNGGGFLPSLPEKGGVIRQIFTSYSTGKAYLRLRVQNVWGSWKCFADGGNADTVNGRASWRISTIDQNGNQWDDSAENINDMYAQWDASKKYFKLKTLGGNNVAVDVATSNSASGTITGLANGTAKTVSLPFSPVFVLFHSNGHVVQGGFALSCGTNSFTITPANVSTMGSTAVGYIAFGG